MVAAKKLPEQALDAVALDRFSRRRLTTSPSRGGLGHRSQGHAKMARMEPLALGLRPQEILAMAEPPLPW